MDKIYRLRVKAKPEKLEEIAHFTEKILGKLEIKYDVMEEILISVDEASSNIIQHSYKNIKSGYIREIIKIKKDKIVIALYDKGKTFDPAKVPSPKFSKNINERALGGLGVFLMKKFMDQVKFSFKNSQKKENELVMVKYLKKEVLNGCRSKTSNK